MDLDRFFEDFEAQFEMLLENTEASVAEFPPVSSAQVSALEQRLRLENLVLGEDFVAGISGMRLVIVPFGGGAEIVFNTSRLSNRRLVTTKYDLRNWLLELGNVRLKLRLGNGLTRSNLTVTERKAKHTLVFKGDSGDSVLLFAPIGQICWLEVEAVDKGGGHF